MSSWFSVDCLLFCHLKNGYKDFPVNINPRVEKNVSSIFLCKGFIPWVFFWYFYTIVNLCTQNVLPYFLCHGIMRVIDLWLYTGSRIDKSNQEQLYVKDQCIDVNFSSSSSPCKPLFILRIDIYMIDMSPSSYLLADWVQGSSQHYWMLDICRLGAESCFWELVTKFSHDIVVQWLQTTLLFECYCLVTLYCYSIHSTCGIMIAYFHDERVIILISTLLFFINHCSALI